MIMVANCNKLVLGAILLLGFCLVGDALVPGLGPLHGDNKKARTSWWFSSGFKGSGSRKLLKTPVGEVGAHSMTTTRRQLAETPVVYKRLCNPLDPTSTCTSTPTPIRRRPCTPYERCSDTPAIPPPISVKPCTPYARCRKYPPKP